jgi:hypothetical protein
VRTNEDRAELAATALMEACYQENVDVLKKLKPDPNRANLTELLNCGAGLSWKEQIPAGAWSPAKRQSERRFDCNGPLHVASASRKYRCVDLSASGFQLGSTPDHGITGRIDEARSYLAPDDSRQMDYIRRGLYQVDPQVTVDLLELFVKTKCCSSETIQSLLRTPRIRQHLKPYE